MSDLLRRLFFTRDDDMDLLQVLFLVIVVVTLAVVWRIVTPAAAEATVREGLITLRWLVGLLVATAVPKWLVPTIAGAVKDRTALLHTMASVRAPSPPSASAPHPEEEGRG